MQPIVGHGSSVRPLQGLVPTQVAAPARGIVVQGGARIDPVGPHMPAVRPPGLIGRLVQRVARKIDQAMAEALAEDAGTALRMAIRLKLGDDVKGFLAQHADPETSLVFAARHREADVVDTLLGRMTDRAAANGIRDRKGWNAYDHAAANSDSSTLRRLFARGEIRNVKGPDGLFSHDRLRATQVAPDISSAAAQVHLRWTEDLCDAVCEGRIATVRNLLAAPGLSLAIGTRDRHGLSPLHYAWKSGNPEMLALLSGDPRIPDTPDPQGMTVRDHLHFQDLCGMATAGDATRLHQQLAAPGRLDFAGMLDRHGMSLLHHAALQQRPQAVDMLLGSHPSALVAFAQADSGSPQHATAAMRLHLADRMVSVVLQRTPDGGPQATAKLRAAARILNGASGSPRPTGEPESVDGFLAELRRSPEHGHEVEELERTYSRDVIAAGAALWHRLGTTAHTRPAERADLDRFNCVHVAWAMREHGQDVMKVLRATRDSGDPAEIPHLRALILQSLEFGSPVGRSAR